MGRLAGTEGTRVRAGGPPALTSAPGHLIRRAQQAHVAVWQHLAPELTSLQYGVLLVLGQQREADQRTVAELMSLDKATAADILRRLERKGLVARHRDRADGRRMLARLTSDGRTALLTAAPAVVEVQDRLLQPLSFDDGEHLLGLLREVAYRGEPPSGTADIAVNAPVPGWPLRLPALRLHTAPGHLIRRAQQLHTLLWTDLVSPVLTSVQYSVLLVLDGHPATDQRMLGRLASLDKSTGGDVLSRLEFRGLVLRTRDAVDTRRNMVRLTTEGHRELLAHAPSVRQVQQELLRPLTASQSQLFIELLQQLTGTAQSEAVRRRPN
ncbi:winged helix-turn-helix transcriptional regulator [Nocardia tengchongensis]|uniref:Winged helix-turn-helix transcriptional regulator n=1 Tax=Nocardia tengchongensis TaxID=2055889 RepID=A0ABX8CJL8_9NOCA|nr:MarR family winged helix-turn-helix transcriptional regulator [Nocardia tengchongensis]QVI19486.1 winged helix-turn-helix transcriptional regulator [Nocardia tengchongensis]